MSVLAISFVISLVLNILIIRYSHLHAHYTADADLLGVQKFHVFAVPRIGGLAIMLAILISLLVRYFQNADVASFGLLLVLVSLPAFLSGFAEDITKKVGILLRLLATIFSAGLASFFLDAWLTNVQIFGLDSLLSAYPVIAIVITCLAVGGVANAFNIIDGYNGLSSMVAVIVLLGIAYVAFQVGDHSIMVAGLAMIGALLGFLFLNYPRGLIFLGDGGAYFVGFWIAELSILLTSRHPEVSKWFPLLLCFYPIFETLFSIYRRVVIKKAHPGMPDASHLHQLIHRRVVRCSGGDAPDYLKVQRNAITSPYLWVLCLFAVIPALLFWRYHLLLKFSALIFSIGYIWLYWAIVRFQTPKFLIINNPSAKSI